jgi:hypothetical protein
MVESYPIPNGLTTEKAMLLAAAVVDRCESSATRARN